MFAATRCLPKFQGLSTDADPWCLNEKTSHVLPFVANPVVVSSAGVFGFLVCHTFCVPGGVFVLNHCALLCCVVCLLGIAIPGSPLLPMHPRFGRCGIFPCGKK